jgi:hypothetical protein
MSATHPSRRALLAGISVAAGPVAGAISPDNELLALGARLDAIWPDVQAARDASIDAVSSADVEVAERTGIPLGADLTADEATAVWEATKVVRAELGTEGLRVTIRRSKTDQEAAGAVVAVCRGSIACPVAAVKDWLVAAGISDGPVFRPVGKGGKLCPSRLSPQNVALIVKTYAARLGLDPATFSGHSLRSGFLTSAAARGALLFKMMDVSRHKSVDTLRGYVRDADAFRDHAGAGLL